MMDQEKMKVEYISVDKLKPYERNARKHTDDDVQYIENSIREFGFNDPIGIWGEQNIIVEGHGRLLAAKNIGMTEVPCIRLDYLTDEQRRAYALAHNKTAEMSEWDHQKLADELNALSFNMDDFGFWTPKSDKPGDPLPKERETKAEKEVVCPRCGSKNVRNAGEING